MGYITKYGIVEHDQNIPIIQQFEAELEALRAENKRLKLERDHLQECIDEASTYATDMIEKLMTDEPVDESEILEAFEFIGDALSDEGTTGGQR